MRIGSVPYLNGKPLVWELDDNEKLECIYEVPSKLAYMLREKSIAAGLVSVAACFTNPNLQILPGISISCIGPARSVKLLYKEEISQIRTLALDTSSLTSVMLAKIILKERYGLSPEFRSMPPLVDEMMGECDAAVVIGDTAMRVRHGRWPELDLGEEWYALTNLPFVFAAWAVNPDMVNPELTEILLRSKRNGLNNLDKISVSESKRLGIPYDICFEYLARIMNYDLTDEHIRGLALFHKKALNHGFIPESRIPQIYTPNSCEVG